MKCLSLDQPWATCVALASTHDETIHLHGPKGKHVETRDWGTSYRGEIAIHATARKPQWPLHTDASCTIAALLVCHGYETAGGKCLDDDKPLPTGCVVAVAKLVDCVRVKSHGVNEPLFWDRNAETHAWLEKNCETYERLYGNWSVDRWLFLLEDIRRLDPPIPAKGHQKIWNWTPPSMFSIASKGEKF